MHPILVKNKDRIQELCSTHKVTKLYAFGSVVNGTFNPASSDVDLIVELAESDPIERGEILLDLWDKLEILFGRNVDLLSNQVIENPYLKASVEESKVMVYDGSSKEILI